MPIITLCSSANFYAQAIEVESQLIALGYEVIIPKVARTMKETGNFNVTHYKTWFANANDYHKKAELMQQHFQEIVKGDATLVLNYEKHGVKNYIGGNVLMEMAVAFFLNKPLYILNDFPSGSAYLEEIKGMLPIVLHGDLTQINDSAQKTK